VRHFLSNNLLCRLSVKLLCLCVTVISFSVNAKFSGEASAPLARADATANSEYSDSITPELAGQNCQESVVIPANLDLDDLDDRQVSDLQVPEGAVIRHIDVYPQDIYPEYGQEENLRWYEVTLNALHPVTYEAAIESQLLFVSGDAFSQDLIDETERNLRGNSYLYNSQIIPVQVCGNMVDLAVVTRDLWTLIPTLGLSRSGGSNRTTIGLSDRNFLGTGKKVSFDREAEDHIVEYSVDYFDPNILGSHWQAGFQLAESSNGERQSAEVSLPFYRVGVPWSFRASGLHDIDDEKRYFRNETLNQFRHIEENYEVAYGLSTFFDGNREERLYIGATVETNQFSETLDTTDEIPANRKHRYPWIGYEWRDNHYLKAYNISQIQQVEDIALGWRHSIELGWSDKGVGASSDQLVFGTESRYRHGDEYRIGSVALQQSGFWDVNDNTSENYHLTVEGDYTQLNQERNQAWFTSLSITYVHNQTLDNQLLLGGSNGLRGYPSNYQTGTHSFLFTAERRFFLDWYPLKTFHVAGVTFFDAGRAWFPGKDNGVNGQVLKDVGFGIRVTSSRIRVTRVLHMDFAFPLDTDDPNIDKMQLILRGQQSF